MQFLMAKLFLNSDITMYVHVVALNLSKFINFIYVVWVFDNYYNS